MSTGPAAMGPPTTGGPGSGAGPTGTDAPVEPSPLSGPPGHHVCRHCGEVHARAFYRDLHIGQAHGPAMDAAEHIAFGRAAAFEADWFRRFRQHVRSGLAVVPVFLLFVLTWVLLSEIEGNAGFGIMLLPAFFAFSALVYGMTFSRLALREGDTKGDVAAGAQPDEEEGPTRAKGDAKNAREDQGER